jgi:hypothetical protein
MFVANFATAQAVLRFFRHLPKIRRFPERCAREPKRADKDCRDRHADAHDENENVMADKTDMNSPASNPARPGQSTSGASAEERLEANLPTQEKEQPDPALQLSHGRLSAGSITLVGVLIALVLGVVFYALNSPAP